MPWRNFTRDSCQKLLTNMDEVWKSVKVYGNVYKISNFGRVMSTMYTSPKIMKPVIRAGYESVGLKQDSIQKTFLIHAHANQQLTLLYKNNLHILGRCRAQTHGR